MPAEVMSANAQSVGLCEADDGIGVFEGQVVDRDELFDVEPKLLDEARALMGRLPFDQLDLLLAYHGSGSPHRLCHKSRRGR